MFEYDREEREKFESHLLEANEVEQKAKQREIDSWKNFSILCKKIKEVSNIMCDINYNRISWLIYKNDKFIVLYDTKTYSIFRKIKLFKRRFLKSICLTTIKDAEVIIDNNNDEIQKVDYSHVSDYEELFQEMNNYYIKIMQEKVYDINKNVAFKKLVSMEF